MKAEHKQIVKCKWIEQPPPSPCDGTAGVVLTLNSVYIQNDDCTDHTFDCVMTVQIDACVLAVYSLNIDRILTLWYCTS